MKRLEAIISVFEEVSPGLRPKYSVVDRLSIACTMVRLAETYNEYLAQVGAEYEDDPDDLVDAFENPFKILEDEIAPLRLRESEDWE